MRHRLVEGRSPEVHPKWYEGSLSRGLYDHGAGVCGDGLRPSAKLRHGCTETARTRRVNPLVA